MNTVRTAAGFTGPRSQCVCRRTTITHGLSCTSSRVHCWIKAKQFPRHRHQHAAPAGYRFTVIGLGGYAGALLMPDRKDALCAAFRTHPVHSKSTLLGPQERSTPLPQSAPAMSTPEQSPAFPAASSCNFDIRDPTDPTTAGRPLCEPFVRDYEGLRQRRKVTITEELVNADAFPRSPPRTPSRFWKTSAPTGRNPHTKQWSAAPYPRICFFIGPHRCSVAMIFIPCRNGVSHRPG